jgi:hypothetical protein
MGDNAGGLLVPLTAAVTREIVPMERFLVVGIRRSLAELPDAIFQCDVRLPPTRAVCFFWKHKTLLL